MISSSRVKAVNHDKLAGLQIVDAIASSAFYAVNRSQYGEIEDRYLRILGRLIYRNRTRAEGYGLKVRCGDHVEKERLAKLTSLLE